MATWEDVRRIALELPETSEGVSRDLRRWTVKDKGFVWERPLRKTDYEALGDAAPEGPILDEISLDDLRETIVEAWLARAPKRLVERYLGER